MVEILWHGSITSRENTYMRIEFMIRYSLIVLSHPYFVRLVLF